MRTNLAHALGMAVCVLSLVIGSESQECRPRRSSQSPSAEHLILRPLPGVQYAMYGSPQDYVHLSNEQLRHCFERALENLEKGISVPYDSEVLALSESKGLLSLQEEARFIRAARALGLKRDQLVDVPTLLEYVGALQLSARQVTALVNKGEKRRHLVTDADVALGFLVAEPVREVIEIEQPGDVVISRSFVPAIPSIHHERVKAYALKLDLSYPGLEAVTVKSGSSPLQTIMEDGQMLQREWTFRVTSERPFGQGTLFFEGEILKFASKGDISAGKKPLSRRKLDLPIPAVTIRPAPRPAEPTSLEKIAKLAAMIKGVLDLIVWPLVVLGLVYQFRKHRRETQGQQSVS